jgi:hypothetical protein
MKAKKGQEKVESMAIKLFRFNYARDLFNIYSKEYCNKKMKVRKEIQEYRNKPLATEFMYRIKDIKNNSNKTFSFEF